MPSLTYSPYTRKPRTPSRGQFYLPPLNWQIRGWHSRGRLPYHQACAERRRRLHRLAFHTLDQETSGQPALLDDRLTNGRERRTGPCRRGHVVETYDGEVFGHPQPRRLGGRHHTDGRHVAHGKHTGRPPPAPGQRLERPRARGDRDARPDRHRLWGAGPVDGFAVAGEAPGRRRRAVHLRPRRREDEDR